MVKRINLNQPFSQKSPFTVNIIHLICKDRRKEREYSTFTDKCFSKQHFLSKQMNIQNV